MCSQQVNADRFITFMTNQMTQQQLIAYRKELLSLGRKLTLGWYIFAAYRSFQQFDALSDDLKAELKELK